MTGPAARQDPASPRALRGVLFDAAGTLIELREPVGETYARAAREFGVELPAWRIGEAFGRILRQAPPMAFPDAAAEERAAREREWWRAVVRSTFRATDGTARFRDFDACFELLWRHFSDSGAWRARPGSHEALIALRQRGLATAVVSNFDQRLHAILQGLDLAGFLDTVVLPADAGAAKPDRRIFALALKRLGLPPAAAAYVGDDADADLAGARAAGLRAVDVRVLATLALLPAHLGLAPASPSIDEETA